MSQYKIIGGDGRHYGPVAAEELRKWIAENRLNAQSKVQLEDGAEWSALGSLPEFADLFQASAPPPVAQPVNPGQWSREILARPTELSLGECFSAGFSFLSRNPGFAMGSVLVATCLNVVMGFVPMIGGILQLLLAGVVTGGLYYAVLRRMRGESVGVGNLFDGFKLCFVQLMLVGAISKLLISLGFVFCLLPGIYLLIAWCFALPLAVDKRLEFWSAMELSRKVATRVWFQLFLLLAVVYLPFLLAQTLAGLKIGGFVLETLREADFDMTRWLQAMPNHLGQVLKLSFLWAGIGQAAFLICQFFAVGALMHAYESLFGQRRS